MYVVVKYNKATIYRGQSFDRAPVTEIRVTKVLETVRKYRNGRANHRKHSLYTQWRMLITSLQWATFRLRNPKYLAVHGRFISWERRLQRLDMSRRGVLPGHQNFCCCFHCGSPTTVILLSMRNFL